MNPWRKRRRQKLRRQNSGAYLIPWPDLDLGPWLREFARQAVIVLRKIDNSTEESDADLIKRAYGIDFTKLMPRISHDQSEFYTLHTP